MDNKKIKLLIGASLLVVILLLSLSSFGDVKYSSKSGLTYSQKRRDAKYLLDFLENTYPYFDELEKESGQYILKNKNKNKIINTISKTTSDEAFYESISNLFRKFTYGTAEITTDWEYFGNSFTYVDKDSNINYSSYRDKALKGKVKWQSIQNSMFAKNFIQGDTNFIYINGDYYVHSSQNPKAHIGDKLLTIDGIPVDEYVRQLPPDKYFRQYDYTYEKYICPYFLTLLKDINSEKKITIKNSQGEDKEIDLLPYDGTKPLLENAYSKNLSYTDEEMKAMDKARESRPFIKTLSSGELVTLDFSAFMDASTFNIEPKKKEQLFSAIDKSTTLVIDIRSGLQEDLLYTILEYISPKNLENFNYRVFKKSKINEEFVLDYKSKIGPFITEITSPIETLEKVYPLSKYYIFKEKTFEIKGKNNYKGNVFILFDNSYYQGYGSELLKAVIDNNLATVISNGKHNLKDYQYSNLISTILPNSNLIIEVNGGKSVDENGVFIEDKIITPQVIIKTDTNKIIDRLKRCEGTGIETDPLKQEKFNEKDEYYQEVLKLIK